MPGMRRHGLNLLALRTQRGLSQDELAAASSVSRRTIVRIEAGGHDANASTLRLLAQALGVDPDELDNGEAAA